MAYSDDFGPTPENIKLQLGADSVVHAFDFSDALDTGITISDCTVTAHDTSDTDKTAELVGTKSISGNVVSVPLSAPADPGAGTYHLKFVLTLSDGSTDVKKYNRLTVVNE